ncbi:MAG: PorP/SprF family type IX secretion system membrane protein [Chitinophagales bacterium]
MKKLLTLALITVFAISIKAQDIHFSQYYASPLTLNPSLTGLHNGDFRVAANYRGQWFSIPNSSGIAPYNTYQVSYDHSILRKKLKTSGLGAGLSVYVDEAGNGSLTTQAVLGSVAYHLALDRFGRHRISLGIQGGIVFKRIFGSDLLFEEQWDAGLNSFNPFLNNMEDPNFTGTFMYPDFNAGMTFSSMPSSKFAYYVGFALNHIAEPTETFLGNNFNKIGRRYIAHAGAQWRTSKYFKVLPTVLYMLQTQSQQINLGSAFEYEFGEKIYGFIGGFTRLVGTADNKIENDAIIATVGMEMFNTRVGLSYDFNTSGLRGATKSVGAAEISIIYIHNKEEPGKIDYGKFCPNF